MRLVWLAQARRARDLQLAYIAERDPWAAIDLGDAVQLAIRRLVEYPMSGRPGRVNGTREFVFPRTPYIAVSLVKNEMIVLLRFLHGAQKPPASDPDTAV